MNAVEERRLVRDLADLDRAAQNLATLTATPLLDVLLVFDRTSEDGDRDPIVGAIAALRAAADTASALRRAADELANLVLDPERRPQWRPVLEALPICRVCFGVVRAGEPRAGNAHRRCYDASRAGRGRASA